MNRSAVKEYSCLFTSDIKKKQNKWVDGYLKLHHYNGRIYLLSTTKAVLADTFYRPDSRPLLLPRASTTSSPANTSATVKSVLSEEFLLKEGDEIEFEPGVASYEPPYIVEVGELVQSMFTDLNEIQSKTRQARNENLTLAKQWADNIDAALPSSSKSKAASSSNLSPRPLPLPASNSKTTTPAQPFASTSKSAYKGLGIAPPKSYLDSLTTSTSKSKSKSTTKSTSYSAFPKPFPIPPPPSAAPLTPQQPASFDSKPKKHRFTFSASKTHQSSPYARLPLSTTSSNNSSTTSSNTGTPKLSSIPKHLQPQNPNPTTPNRGISSVNKGVSRLREGEGEGEGGFKVGATKAASSPFRPPSIAGRK